MAAFYDFIITYCNREHFYHLPYIGYIVYIDKNGDKVLYCDMNGHFRVITVFYEWNPASRSSGLTMKHLLLNTIQQKFDRLPL